MIVFLDTNIILDVILKRQPFYLDSYAVLERIIENDMTAYVSASCITDIFYIAKKVIKNNNNTTKAALTKLLTFIDVVSITKVDILKALKSELDDFEDALQIHCALKIKASHIITRDTRINGDFIKIIAPSSFCE